MRALPSIFPAPSPASGGLGPVPTLSNASPPNWAGIVGLLVSRTHPIVGLGTIVDDELDSPSTPRSAAGVWAATIEAIRRSNAANDRMTTPQETGERIGLASTIHKKYSAEHGNCCDEHCFRPARLD